MRVQASKWARKSRRYAAIPMLASLPELPAANPARWLPPDTGAMAQLLLREGGPVADQDGAQWLDGSFTHRGRTLAYKLYVPAQARAGARPPMVVMLHGCTQDAADFAAGTRMNQQARALGVVVLYPEQSQRDNPRKCWNWFHPQHQQRGRGEPAVLAALTQSMAAAHRVDPARIYVAGLSAGGAMADILGATYPELFAAVGVHSGLPRGSATDVVSALAAMRSGAPAPMRAPGGGALPPLIVFHGDADKTVHSSNGQALVDAALQARGVEEDAAGSGAAGSGAAGTGAAEPLKGQSAQGQAYSQSIYRGRDGRTIAEYWQLHGAGHAWSGGHADGSHTDPAGVDASAQMLRFFLAHPKIG